MWTWVFSMDTKTLLYHIGEKDGEENLLEI